MNGLVADSAGSIIFVAGMGVNDVTAIVKVDRSGNRLWDKSFVGKGLAYARLAAGRDARIVVSLQGKDGAYVQEWNADGDMNWQLDGVAGWVSVAESEHMTVVPEFAYEDVSWTR